ncbi:DUF1853 family protein [Aequorivita viscosa]|uniref:DUF1853 domain-containing protein n=1 Tax=Aequorivita viscosa TaxID=797419 RepID=A0A1M6NBX0_9FLAO|nr:DUF1853 family protein [Aequorivita viscosa]SDX45752.1 hypothetical protein SAMN05216556_13219 [Aequorivita viscosa]SHJ93228.1 hypothetical protein SAMN04487908_13311 [Aequorivita viscosa]
MSSKGTEILNSFISAPELKLNSETYPFLNFSFYKEEIAESEFIFPKNSIIGLQAEGCFEAFLKNSKHYRLLASNLQIQGEKGTIGELDYIVQNQATDEVVHIELSCKFYLYDNKITTSEESKWIGPNRKDSLYDKLEKLKSKQFPLIRASETIETLEGLNIDVPSTQQLCLKAFLFVPKEINLNSFSKVYQDCIVGYWMRQKDFIQEDQDALFAIPTKKEWLLPISQITSWISYNELNIEIKRNLKNKKSPLIYRKKRKKTERFFVVWW